MDWPSVKMGKELLAMANTEPPSLNRRVGGVLITQLSSKLRLNLVFLLTWGWGVYWIINTSQSDPSIFIASLPAMLAVAGAWLVLLNRGLSVK